MLRNFYLKFKDKLWCPLVSSLIQLAIIGLVLFPLIAKSKLDTSKGFDNITKKVDEKLRVCGVNYWMSWLVLDANKKEFGFQDVRGFNLGGTKIISPRTLQLNPYYNNIHKIDQKTLKFLSKFETGAAGYYPDLSFFDDKPSAKEIINSANKKVDSVGISVTKDIFRNLVYVFIFSITSGTLSWGFFKVIKVRQNGRLSPINIA